MHDPAAKTGISTWEGASLALNVPVAFVTVSQACWARLQVATVTAHVGAGGESTLDLPTFWAPPSVLGLAPPRDVPTDLEYPTEQIE
jgi:hypothetical protein